MPSTPYDAKGLLKTAIRDDNPVIFFEHKLLYRKSGPVPEEDYVLPLGQADVKRKGKDVTIVTWAGWCPCAWTRRPSLAKDGIEVEVVDPRTLVPLDRAAIVESVREDRPGGDRPRGRPDARGTGPRSPP